MKEQDLFNMSAFDGNFIGTGKRNVVRRLGEREFTVRSTNKWGFQLYFGRALAKEFEPFSHACIYRSKITKKIFLLLFNDADKGAEMKPCTDGSVRIYLRNIALALYDFFDRKRGETICLHLGDNISYISDFATYEITE